METKQKPRQEQRSRPPAARGETRSQPAGAPARNEQRRENTARAGEAPRRETAPRAGEAPRRETAPRTGETPRKENAARTGERKQNAPERSEKQAQSKRPAEKKVSAPEKKRAANGKAPAPRKSAGKKRPAGKEADDVSNKKRTYGKSKPKKKSFVVSVMEDIQKASQKRAEKKKKGKPNRAKQPTPAVIYTEPAAFNRNRLIVQLVTVTAVVLALVIGLSVFFKVERIYVSGAEVYSESAITEVCGISKGDNLLTFSHARAAALIRANRPYVREVRFGIKLPDTVNIIIEEDDVVYAIKDQTGQWWLINSSGRVVEQGNNAKAANYTQVLGVTLDNPEPDAYGVALESAPAVTESTDAQGETVQEVTPVTTTGAQRLDAALEILKALENNDIVGSAASVDVSRIDDIILWYGTRYQVNLGDSARLDYKIACMNAVIAQMSEYQSGILDISFTIWPNQVGYTPFS